MTDTTSTAVAAPQAPGAILSKPLSIRDTVLAQFKDTEAGLQAMADKYRNVVYDVTTTKGMNEAKAARAELRDDGRLAITRAEKKVKADVAELKEVMGTEVERLVAIVKPVEDSIDAQIKVEEKRKLEEKADRERKEADRVAAHRTNIEQLRAYVAQAEGQPLQTINGAIDKLMEMTFGEEWEEFAQQAQAERDNTVVGLRALVQSEEQRIENEKLRAELAALKASAASPPAPAPAPQNTIVQHAHAAIKSVADGEESAPFEVDDWGAMEALQEAPAPAHAPIAPPAPAAGTGKPFGGGSWSRAAAENAAAAPAEASVQDDSTRVSLSQLKERIAPLSIDAAGLETLGFKHVSAGGTSKLYRACDLPAIRDAMVKHLNSINF